MIDQFWSKRNIETYTNIHGYLKSSLFIKNPVSGSNNHSISQLQQSCRDVVGQTSKKHVQRFLSTFSTAEKHISAPNLTWLVGLDSTLLQRLISISHWGSSSKENIHHQPVIYVSCQTSQKISHKISSSDPKNGDLLHSELIFFLILRRSLVPGPRSSWRVAGLPWPVPPRRSGKTPPTTPTDGPPCWLPKKHVLTTTSHCKKTLRFPSNSHKSQWILQVKDVNPNAEKNSTMKRLTSGLCQLHDQFQTRLDEVGVKNLHWGFDKKWGILKSLWVVPIRFFGHDLGVPPWLFRTPPTKKIETTTTVGFDEPILSPMATVDHIHNFAGGCSHDHLQALMKCIGSRTISLLLVSTPAATSRSMLSIGVRSSFRDCCTPQK